MGLLDGMERFLEEKLFKKMEVQFKELIGVLREISAKFDELIKIQRERRDDVLGKGREV